MSNQPPRIMINQPPRDAVRQPDGSFLKSLEDGSTMRWTRRPDGTWRKPEHKRAGWTGSLEQRKYVPKGLDAEQAYRAELKAHYCRDVVKPGTAKEKRYERRKLLRRERAELKLQEAYQLQEVGEVLVEVPECWESRSESPNSVEGQSCLVAERSERQAVGQALKDDQLAMFVLDSKAKLELPVGDTVSGAVQDALQAPSHPRVPARAVNRFCLKHPNNEERIMQPPTPAGQLEVQMAQMSLNAPRIEPTTQVATGIQSRRALEKKLRQIAELEAKQARGEMLNSDQLAKLTSKLCVVAAIESLD